MEVIVSEMETVMKSPVKLLLVSRSSCPPTGRSLATLSPSRRSDRSAGECNERRSGTTGEEGE